VSGCEEPKLPDVDERGRGGKGRLSEGDIGVKRDEWRDRLQRDRSEGMRTSGGKGRLSEGDIDHKPVGQERRGGKLERGRA